MGVSYIDSSRRVCFRCWGKDVHHRRACHRLRRGGECGVWGHLLGNDIVLRKERDGSSAAFFLKFLDMFPYKGNQIILQRLQFIKYIIVFIKGVTFIL